MDYNKDQLRDILKSRLIDHLVNTWDDVDKMSIAISGFKGVTGMSNAEMVELAIESGLGDDPDEVVRRAIEELR